MAKGSKKGACSSNTQPAKRNCLEHNRRARRIPTYVDSSRTCLNRSVYESDTIKKRKSLVPLIERAKQRYTEKTGQKCQASFAPYRESVLHVKEGITDKQLMQFKRDAEALLGWKVIGIWLHQDEGHAHSKYIEGDENFEINYHAHVLWDCCDPETGKILRPTRGKFAAMQDLLAGATGMERGNPAAETGIKHRTSQKQRIKAQEERIAELERVAAEKEYQLQELEQEKQSLIDNVTKSNKELEDLIDAIDEAKTEAKSLDSIIKDAKARIQGAKEGVLDLITGRSKKEAKAAQEKAQEAIREADEEVHRAEYREQRAKKNLEEASELIDRKNKDIAAYKRMVQAAVKVYPRISNVAANLDILERLGLPLQRIQELYRDGAIRYSGRLHDYKTDDYIDVTDLLIEIIRSTAGDMLVWLARKTPSVWLDEWRRGAAARERHEAYLRNKAAEEQGRRPSLDDILGGRKR